MIFLGKDFCNFLSQNFKSIYYNFNNVFKINYEEYLNLMKIVMKNLYYDNFYKNLLCDINFFISFDKESLLEIQNYFMSVGLLEEKIKKLILSTPQILFFSNNLNNIFPIFKNRDFVGVALLHGNDYRAYSFNDLNLNLILLNTLLKESDVNDCNYLVENMLKSLDREDVVETLNFKFNSDTPLINKFEILSTDYSKKNYYFKKK